jgi:uncharacterized protein YecT (DUF1311 family)
MSGRDLRDKIRSRYAPRKLAFVLVCLPFLIARGQTSLSRCIGLSTAGSERCDRLAMDSAVAKLDRTVGRVLELLPDSLRAGFLALSEKGEEYRRLECERLYASFEGGMIAGSAIANCYTRLSDERAAFLAGAYQFDRMASTAHGGCLTYEPDTVALEGRLSRRTFPGPPNYESVAGGDEPETGFYLTVRSPLCVSRNLNELNGPIAGVRVVQLVLDQRGYDRLRPLLGGSVTLRGALFHSYTGHHHAKLLLSVVK